MPDQEFDHFPVIQDYHRFVADRSLPGVIADSNEITNIDCRFLPFPDLKRYLGDDGEKDRLLDILNKVLPSTGPPSVAPSTVRGKYLKVFAILLCIRKSPFIQCFVIHPGLSDTHLPFVQRPHDFPTSPDFFDAFYEQQWMFCSPEIEYWRTMVLPARTILPITFKERIGAGGDAIVHRIDVHPAYNKLRVNSTTSLDPSNPLYNTFALKSYHRDSGEQYNRELDSFVHLRSTVGSSVPNLIGFYGSYTHDRTSNVILEYANERTLEDYFKSVPPPSTGPEIYQFWSGLLSLLRALDALHNLPYGETNHIGCHQDVTPRNILVCRREGQSMYECEFKLADFGLSHIHIDGVSKGEDAGGTRLYGAPELYRYDKSRFLPHIVTPAADLWSLGCLFNEAAVWLVHGMEETSGLHNYRAQREEETRNTTKSEDPGCFHNGAEILDCVAATYRTLPDNIRRCDTLTEDVLVMTQLMLVPLATRRPHTSSSLWLTASAHLRKGKDMSLQSRHPGNGRSASTLAAPASPREHGSEAGLPHPGLQQERRSEAANSVHPLLVGPTSSSSSFLLNGGSFVSGVSSAAPSSDWSNTTGPDCVHYDTSGNSYHPTSNSTIDPNIHPLRRRPGPCPLAGTDTAAATPTAAANPPNSIPKPPLCCEHYSSEPPSSLGRSNCLACDPSTPDKPVLGSRPESRHAGVYSSGNPPIDILQPPEATSKDKVERPEFPISDAIKWKEKTQKIPFKEAIKELPDGYSSYHFRVSSLTSKNVLSELGDRDHVFLLDNSTSMATHWPNVLKLLGLLAYIVSESGRDGEDIYFTIGNDHKKYGRTEKLVDFARDHHPPPESPGQRPRYSNISTRLWQILQEYRSRLSEETNNPTRPRRSSSFFRTPPKPPTAKLSLYIFTDGVWQPQSDADSPIASIADKLEDLRLDPARIGVQFIQFGNDAEGTARLKRLDEGLGLRRDVVDAEPFEGGDVWKMLLGSINKWYDSDDNGAAEGGDIRPPLLPPLPNGTPS